MANQVSRRTLRLIVVIFVVGLVTAFYHAVAFANTTTVALTFLLIVFAAATRWGLLEAIAASLFATFCFHYYVLPPVGTWTIADPQNWIALFVFLIVSIVASQLSERARRMANESARAREVAAQAEMVRKSEQFKSTLLDTLAHDLKTPLTSLKASASALLTNPAQFSAEQRELLTIVEEEADRLNRLVTEVLRLARVEAGKLRLNRESCSVETLIRLALDDAKRLLEDREVQVHIAPALPPVSADAELIRTVIRHLLENSAKYSLERGSITVSADREGRFIRVQVRDQGQGLSEEELSVVFEKYYRGPGTRDAVPGLGMGLAIARDIVVAHGGRIWAESVPGEGAAFSFTSPVAAEARQ